jgi:hypothetical protein
MLMHDEQKCGGSRYWLLEGYRRRYGILLAGKELVRLFVYVFRKAC